MKSRRHHDRSGPGPGPDPEQPGAPVQETRLLAVVPCDGGVEFVLDDGRRLQVAAGSLPPDLPAPGEVVPADVLRDLLAAAARKLAARDLLDLLDRRLRPVARLRQLLLDRGHPPEAVAAVLQQMQEQGLCSDLRFAEAYCRDCLLTKAVGSRYLEAKLMARQIPGQVAAQAVAAVLEPERERELARQAARSRWRRLGGRGDRQAEAKVVRFLQARGFPPALALRAARDERPAPADPAATAEE